MRRDFPGRLLEYLRTPHLRKEAIDEFEAVGVSGEMTRLFNEGRLVKSSPVKVEVEDKRVGTKNVTTCFFLNPIALGSGGAALVPELERHVRFYYHDSWKRNFNFQRHKLNSSMVLGFLGEVKAATPKEVADHFNVDMVRVKNALTTLMKRGAIVRRGRKNRFGAEVRVPKIGFVYGVDYEAISKKLDEVLRDKKFAPTLHAALQRIDADSRAGEVTAEILLRGQFRVAPTQLAVISRYCQGHKDYEVFRWGQNQWFCNKRLMLGVMSEEEMEQRVKEAIDGVQSVFNSRLLSGIALEIAVRKALKLWGEFENIEMNKYIPLNTPYGREIDFVATSKLISEKVANPIIFVGEIKLTKVRQEQVRRFYNKIRYTHFITFAKKNIGLSSEVSLNISRKVEIPVRLIKSNVTLMFIGLDFTKEAVEECKELGIVWAYADRVLERLGEKIRRKVYAGRIIRVVKTWVDEQRRLGAAFVSRKEIRRRLERLLSEKLGI